jgi:hypothetical protein
VDADDMKNIAAQWRAWHERDMNPKEGLPACMPGYRAARESYDPGFKPDAYSVESLSTAVFLAVVDYDHEFVREILDLASVVGRRIEADPVRWDGVWNTGHQGLYRGDLVAAVTLAEAWRDGVAPVTERLRSAASDLSRNATTIGYWEALEQSQYLRASQLLLIAGDIDAATELINARKRFSAIARYFHWYKEWLTCGMSREAFDELFDVVRAPDWVSERGKRNGIQLEEVSGVLKLRLALLRL